MLKMVGATIIVFLFVSAAVAEECANPRKVDIIVEVKPNNHTEHEAAEINTYGFFESLLLGPGPKRCWEARITVFDAKVVPIKSFECHTHDCMKVTWTQLNDTNTPRTNIASHLSAIVDEVGERFISEDSSPPPPPLIVLVLSNYSKEVDEIRNAADRLKELRYKFVAVGVGNDWDYKHFEGIVSKTSGIMILDNLITLDPFSKGGFNQEMLNTLDDPDRESTRIGAYSSEGSGYKTCSTNVDLGFVLDSSGSLKKDYELEKHFIKMIAKSFNVKRGGTHAGVVTFSDRAELSIKLSDTSDYDQFFEDVDQIQHMDSITRIDLALKKARDELFAKINGGRGDKKKVLVVLTDGSQTYNNVLGKDALDPAPVADEIRKQGIELLVIGIGLQIKEDELKRIAGPKDNYRQANDFQELSSKKFAANMTTKLCDIVTTEECQKIVDICFLIDSSGSIKEQTDWVTTKEFVRRLSNAFKFSEDGAHGSVVVFSDKITKKNAYTKVVIKLNNGLTATDFGRKIEETPYIGYRTRIDLGFNLIENQVFTTANGARPKIKKAIVLITDGRQNPKNFDAVLASQKLYNDGVNIYAIGIGRQIDINQLNRITRQPHRVFKAESFKYLESNDFLNAISTTVCTAGKVTPPEEKTCCCPSIDENLKESMGKKLVDVVTKEMGESCKNKCADKDDEFVGVVGVPAAVPRPSRKRRAINMDDETMEEEVETLGVLSKLSKIAGCNIFWKALQKYGILKNISSLIEENKQVSIFCPKDDAYEKLYTREDFANNKMNILLNHIGVKHDTFGRVYQTLLSGSQIIFNTVEMESGKIARKANDADIVVSLADGVGSEIIVVDDIIPPTKRKLLEVLKSNSNVSLFYDLLVKSQLTDIFQKAEIEKICFTQDMCLAVTSSMFKQIKAAVSFNQFTICAPTDNMLLNMKKSQLKLLMTDEASRKQFLQEYVFLGPLASPSSNSREIAYSLSEKHFVLTTKIENNMMVLKRADGKKFRVKDTILAAEGIVHIIEMAN